MRSAVTQIVGCVTPGGVRLALDRWLAGARRVRSSARSSALQFDKSVTVLKLRAARDRASRRVGRRIEGAKAFGSLPGEAATLARLLELPRTKGLRGRPLSMQAIADTLNAEGRPTRGREGASGRGNRAACSPS